MDEHTRLPNAALTSGLRPRRHMLRPGIYIQGCSINNNVVTKGHEVTVNYGPDYCKPPYTMCDWIEVPVGRVTLIDRCSNFYNGQH
jgi:hypothetical protein